MNQRKKRRGRSTPPCRELSSDDGIDPRSYFRERPSKGKRRRKTLQLCAQVAQALRLALSGMDDERLHVLDLVRVEPAPDASRLRVLVRSHDPQVPRSEVQARLEAAHASLRSVVAQAIHRKRVPELEFLTVAEDPS